jgi:hypothetical protein
MIASMRLALLFVTAASFAAPATAAERRYSLTDFDRIEVQGPFEVVLTTGGPTSGLATGPQAAIERVMVEVQGRTLRIHADHSVWGGYPGSSPGAVRIGLSTRELFAAGVAGAGSLAIDKARGARLDLELAGNGTLTIGRLDVDSLVVTMVGSGQMTLAGHAKQMRATFQGSGDLKAGALTVGDADVNAATAGSVTLEAVRSAKIVSSGPGEVSIAGSPACTVQNKGSGTVRCGRGQ